MESVNISGRNYYLLDDIQQCYRHLFKGCKSARELITKKHFIPDNRYIYARFNKINDSWDVSDGSSRKMDKIFVSKKYFDSIDIGTDVVYDDLPSEIFLEDDEKFIDNDGNIVEITVVGERDVNNCYFCVKDIMEGFDLPNLHDNIIRANSSYEENVHHKYFYSEKVAQNRNRKKKVLYLTYYGILKTLFGTTKKTTNKFITWATSTLFTAQLGTVSQKHKLVANLLSVSTDAVKAVFDRASHTIPCIYLFSVGKVSDLRQSMHISNKFDDNSYVYKYGMTKDLERRTKEHEKSFKKIPGTNLELATFSFIDPQYISIAEQKISDLMTELKYKFEYDTQTELAIISGKQFKFVKEQFAIVSKLYLGQVTELVTKIKEKDNEIALLKERHEKEINEERHKNELLVHIHEKELLIKEVEILKLQNKKKN